MTKVTPIQAAQAALDGHDAALRLEPGNGPRVALFHLLASLVEWSDAQSPRVDFDAVLGEVREHFAGETDDWTEDDSAALKGEFKAYFAAHGYPNSIGVMRDPALQSMADEHPNEWAEACQEWESDQ